MSSGYAQEIKLLIDNTFGSDVNSLPKIDKLYHEMVAKKQALEKQMTIVDGDNDASSSALLRGIARAEGGLTRADGLADRKRQLVAEIESLLERSSPGSGRFERAKLEIEQLQRYVLYMKYMARMNETSDSIQQSILSDSMTDACCCFKRLVTEYGCLIDNKTRCRHLADYLRRTIMFWYRILKDKLSADLEEILKSINWPFVKMRGPDKISRPLTVAENTNKGNFPKAQPDPTARLDSIVGNLLNIQLPKRIRKASLEQKDDGGGGEDRKRGESGFGDGEDDDGGGFVLLPFQIMLRPLRKRFHYHFSGAKETNAIDKPEWYLAQVLNWVEYHAGFLEHTIQPILDNHKHQYVDALVMFTQGLLQLVTCKLAIDMDNILYSDELFSHVLDEVLTFDRDLRALHDIPASLLARHSPLNVLTAPLCIRKWLAIEKSWANEKLEALLDSEQSWKPRFSAVSCGATDGDDADEEAKVPECAESVVTMLLMITDRYKNLPSWEEKVRFLDLQLNLLDDFRLRITQIIRSIACSFHDNQTFAILNAAYYVTVVLGEWADNIFFLELKYRKSEMEKTIVPDSLIALVESQGGGSNNKADATSQSGETVFDETIALYRKITEDGVESLLHQTLNDLKMKCYSYITDSWSTLPEACEQVNMVVSRSACPFLALLQERLVSLEEKLCSFLFAKLWRAASEQIDIFLFHEVVMKNRFNSGGAAQLAFDITRNLFPIFRPYTNKPDNYFKRMKEACLLLNLQLGSALLLKESVVEDEQRPAVEAARMLAEMGVHLIKPRDAATLLTRRTDWPTADDLVA